MSNELFIALLALAVAIFTLGPLLTTRDETRWIHVRLKKAYKTAYRWRIKDLPRRTAKIIKRFISGMLGPRDRRAAYLFRLAVISAALAIIAGSFGVMLDHNFSLLESLYTILSVLGTDWQILIFSGAFDVVTLWITIAVFERIDRLYAWQSALLVVADLMLAVSLSVTCAYCIVYFSNLRAVASGDNPVQILAGQLAALRWLVGLGSRPHFVTYSLIAFTSLLPSLLWLSAIVGMAAIKAALASSRWVILRLLIAEHERQSDESEVWKIAAGLVAIISCIAKVIAEMPSLR